MDIMIDLGSELGTQDFLFDITTSSGEFLEIEGEPAERRETRLKRHLRMNERMNNVLWPECGWTRVSLTDMITANAVKKVYHKASLYVHPDKVQQRGATLQQKYIAEKVFDLLKEAWNKFSAEELR